ncbi:MAG: hypothetical protein HQK50_06560 [Oligoflexia bacterium]|nr:hypothetical protein [Oligoflexia bacterium]MBF0365214.1 hypothetical protein [Oligoflexia bacterium]
MKMKSNFLSACLHLRLALCFCTLLVSLTSFANTKRELPFEQWCTEWGLLCNHATPTVDDKVLSGIPTAMNLVEAFLLSDSIFKITDADLDDPALKLALEELGGEKILDFLFTYQKLLGLNEARKQQQEFVFNFAEAKEILTPSNLIFHYDPEVRLSVNAQHLEANLSGVSLKSSQSPSTYTQLLKYKVETTSHTTAAATFETDQEITTGAPLNFLIEEFRLGLEELKSNKDASTEWLEKIIKVTPALATWLFCSDRVLDLDRNFLDTLLLEWPTLTTNNSNLQFLKVITESLDRLQTRTNANGSMIAATVQPKKYLNCKFSGSKATLSFESKFGIKDLKTIGDENNAMEITLYGVKAKVGFLSKKITRVDLYKDKAVVQDIPVIGSYTIYLSATDDNQGQNQVTCSVR